ncbi:hypothetical protein Micbo1qcDRAFT_190858 [Microdochium bolleyi]|uniref:D-xylose 1-dehydrogenase (NADP(+), D-xylono-1,5-lactone-forming) n=1 Tax=Microdochium bolleyi TaxID=196109 RepID=A0A136ILE4_9PEZI|nr:hypothetical protein Micbo1qcDRAFT_190858 [Microdochium bolleyi]
MASILGFFNRVRQQYSPPAATKDPHPLRFGIMSAANIAPMAFLTPAISHPEVVVTAVAARDPAKAAAFAKKHKIPKVKQSYQDLLDDPDIDCVYIPLPNGLHYEWALRALRAGKHVLLEKPGTSNAIEAEKLFRHPLLSEPGAPVLLEATHSWFHPAWARFMSFVDSAEIDKARATMMAPAGFIADDDIRFDYDLAGGAMMDTGPYTLGCLRLAFGGELPAKCEKASWEPPRAEKARKEHIENAYEAHFRFANGGLGVARGSLNMPLTEWETPNLLEVTHRPVVVEDERELNQAGVVAPGEAQQVVRIRTVSLSLYVMPSLYHNIHVRDEYTLRETGRPEAVIRRWTKTANHKAYTFREAGVEQPGEIYWSTYRYCLEQFVHRVKGRETQQWFDVEDSINSARMIDMAYEAAGLALRPTSKYE